MYELTLHFETKQELIGFLDSTREADTTVPPDEANEVTLEQLKAAVLKAQPEHREQLRELFNEFKIKKAGDVDGDRRTELYQRVTTLA